MTIGELISALCLYGQEKEDLLSASIVEIDIDNDGNATIYFQNNSTSPITIGAYGKANCHDYWDDD